MKQSANKNVSKIPPLLARKPAANTIPPLLRRVEPVKPTAKKAPKVDVFNTDLNVLAPTGKPWPNQNADWGGQTASKENAASASMINSLREKARAWARDVVKLANTPVPPIYSSEKNRLINTARVIKTTLEKVLQVDLPELKNAGLGVIPLVVGAAVVSGAAAAIVKWSVDYKTLTAKIANYDKMVADGIPPKNAADLTRDISATADTQTTFGRVVKYLPLIGAGIVAAIVVPAIMRGRSKNA